MNSVIVGPTRFRELTGPIDYRKTIEVALILGREEYYTAHILDYDREGAFFGINLLVGCKMATVRTAYRMVMSRLKAYQKYYQVVLVRLPELDWTEDCPGPMTNRGRMNTKAPLSDAEYSRSNWD